MPDPACSASAGGPRRRPTECPRCRTWLGPVLAILALDSQAAYAQAPTPAQESDQAAGSKPVGASTTIEELARRMQLLERQNAELADQNRSLTRQLDNVTRRYDELNRRLEQIEPGQGRPTAPLPTASLPDPDSGPQASGRPPSAPDPRVASDPDAAPGPAGTCDPVVPPGPSPLPGAPDRPWIPRFAVGDYDDERGAFVLVRPTDAQRVPFELRADLFTQARYFNFGRSKDTWTDSTGARMPVRGYDSVEVTRNFVQFSGYGIDPRLQFTAVIFSSTAINDTVYLGWINYHFNDALDLRVGNWLVPGTREWYTSFRYTLGADRLMATTFFRPNISPGIWLQGEPIRGLNYVAMFANSLNRFTQGVERVGSSGAFGGTVWWEPLGDFGPGPSDIENHRSLNMRLGTSLALSREANQGFGLFGPGNPEDAILGNPEDTILRLSDGTPLFRPGALGPGVLLSAASVQLWALDAAFKYRGFSLTGEYFLRWIDGFQAAGRRPSFSSLFDNGGLLEGSYFVVPSKVEAFARTSFVTGRFGGGNEFGGGVNWYPRGARDWRFTFEVLEINRSPAQNLLTGYRAGESGTLFQLQWFTDF
jgi:hypothetical protein